MLVHYCDRCGKLIKNNAVCSVRMSVPVGESDFKVLHEGMPWNTPPKNEFELCGECASKVWNFTAKRGDD